MPISVTSFLPGVIIGRVRQMAYSADRAALCPSGTFAVIRTKQVYADNGKELDSS
jgi:hypothetical protein